MHAESLIFDVDGTLWNSVDLVVKGWNLALEEAGLAPTCTAEGIRPLFGKTMDEIARAFLPDQAPKRRQEIMDSCMVWEERVMAGGSLRYFLPRGAGRVWEALAQRHRLFYCQQLSEGIYRAPSGKRKFGNLDSGPCLLRRNRPVQRGDHSPFDEAQ